MGRREALTEPFALGTKVSQMTVRMTEPWHCRSAQQAAQTLGVDVRTGLPTERAARELVRHGPNRLIEQGRRGLGRILLGQFGDFMILVLIAAAAISGLLGELIDSIAILVIIALNAVIGVVQEYRAERALEALKRLAVPQATVRRDGRPVTVPSEALVPGDPVLLEAGNLVPADVRLIEAAALQADEAALTGESTPVMKLVEALDDPGLGVGDRSNMLFRGTLVTDGLPGLALSFEPGERGLMRRPPRPPGESVFAHGMGWHMLGIGLFIGGLSIASQAWAFHSGSENWQTVVFNVLTFAQLFHVLAIRSEQQPLWRIGLLSNRP